MLIKKPRNIKTSNGSRHIDVLQNIWVKIFLLHVCSLLYRVICKLILVFSNSVAKVAFPARQCLSSLYPLLGDLGCYLGELTQIDSLFLGNNLSFDPLEPQELCDGSEETFPYCSLGQM